MICQVNDIFMLLHFVFKIVPERRTTDNSSNEVVAIHESPQQGYIVSG